MREPKEVEAIAAVIMMVGGLDSVTITAADEEELRKHVLLTSVTKDGSVTLRLEKDERVAE